MKWSRDPLVSRNHRLNSSCRLPAHAHDTACRDATVTIHHRSPPPHVGQPSLSRMWAHRDSSPTSLLPPHACTLLLLSALPPSLCSPSPAVVKPARRRPCESIALPSSAEGAATPTTLNQWLTAPGDHFSPLLASSTRSHHRLTAPDLLQPSQRLEELRKTPLFLFYHTSTTGDPPSASPMSFPFHRIVPPPIDRSGENPTTLHPKSDSPSIGLAPRPLHCQPVGFCRHTASADGEEDLPCFCRGPKGPSGLDPLAGPDSANYNSGISLLSFELFKLYSKFSLNFKNS
jgi:hypothetical protein